jgi:hypothetical protein
MIAAKNCGAVWFTLRISTLVWLTRPTKTVMPPIFHERTILLLVAVASIALGLPALRRTEQEGDTSQMQFQLSAKGSLIDARVGQGELAVSQDELKRWVENAADAVVAYYGRFPVPHLRLEIEPSSGNGIRGGKTFGRGGGLIIIRVGSQTPGSELASDWMMTHEMVHLAFPSMADEHHWIEEGIATYAEPIGRIEAGQMDAAEMWRDLVRDMPKGQPRAGDKGLDHTHTWGRTYWGGALYCLQADVEIRRETQNAKGLQDALRGILEAGGDIREDWELRKTLEIGDRATATHVLMNLYESMKDKPVGVDLDTLWKQLGVKVEDGEVVLVDGAPLAGVRRAITPRRAGP